MKQYNKKLYYCIGDKLIIRGGWILEWLCQCIVNTFRYGLKKVNVKQINHLRKNDSLVIIANGPSINQSLDQILNHTDCDYACMNYFPITCSEFDEMKPILFFGHDAMLFDSNYPDVKRKQDSILLKEKLETVSWKMTAFTTRDESFLLNNKNIKEYRINPTQIKGWYTKFRGRLFDRDLAIPVTHSVTTSAILTGIRMGYKTIYVYGIDNSMFEGIDRSNPNHFVVNPNHFYEDTARKENEYGNCESTFADTYYSLVGYGVLEEYSKNRGTKVYNCTPKSYVDAFEFLLSDTMIK